MNFSKKRVLQVSYFVYAGVSMLFIAFPLAQKCQQEEHMGIYCYQIYVRMIVAGVSLNYFISFKKDIEVFCVHDLHRHLCL